MFPAAIHQPCTRRPVRLHGWEFIHRFRGPILAGTSHNVYDTDVMRRMFALLIVSPALLVGMKTVIISYRDRRYVQDGMRGDALRFNLNHR